jgi:hypothetical protein
MRVLFPEDMTEQEVEKLKRTFKKLVAKKPEQVIKKFRPETIAMMEEKGCWLSNGAHRGYDEEGYPIKKPVIAVRGKPVHMGVVGMAIFRNMYDIPKLNLEARHQCKNPLCVDYFHLSAGAKPENDRDRKLEREKKRKEENG